jgi:hypothetical protein
MLRIGGSGVDKESLRVAPVLPVSAVAREVSPRHTEASVRTSVRTKAPETPGKGSYPWSMRSNSQAASSQFK